MGLEPRSSRVFPDPALEYEDGGTEREEKAAVAIRTNPPFSEWGTDFPDPRLVAATVDRVTFNAHILETGTQSYRLAASKTTAQRKRAG